MASDSAREAGREAMRDALREGAAKATPTLERFKRAFPPDKVTHVLYHAHCYDGLAAAWVAHHHAAAARRPKPALVPVRAGCTWIELVEQCPALLAPPAGFCALFVDVAPTRSVTQELRSRGVRFGVLDHHKSNARELTIPEAYYNMERSGCILSYFYFFGQVHDAAIPWVLLYLEDRDLFRWKHGDSHMFHLGWTVNVPANEREVFPILNTLVQRAPESEHLHRYYVQAGLGVYSMVKTEADTAVSDGQIMRVSFDKGATARTVLVSNYSNSLMHDVGHLLVTEYYDMVIFWRRSHKTHLVHSTLITSAKRGLDMSEISSHLASLVDGSGGGHELAAGMQTRVEPEVLLQTFALPPHH